MSTEEKRERQRIAAKKSRLKHMAAIKEKQTADRYERREYLLNLLGMECNRCHFKPVNENEYCVLDFHHIDKKTKSFNISSGLMRQLPALVDEVNKCELLCANCHRIETRLNPGKGCKVRSERQPISQYPRQKRVLSQETKDKIAESVRYSRNRWKRKRKLKAHPISDVLINKESI
jgi:hypothetical protein